MRKDRIQGKGEKSLIAKYNQTREANDEALEGELIDPEAIETEEAPDVKDK
jgi:hypothetical protein